VFAVNKKQRNVVISTFLCLYYEQGSSSFLNLSPVSSKMMFEEKWDLVRSTISFQELQRLVERRFEVAF
jgi:hypothetical protein